MSNGELTQTIMISESVGNSYRPIDCNNPIHFFPESAEYCDQAGILHMLSPQEIDVKMLGRENVGMTR